VFGIFYGDTLADSFTGMEEVVAEALRTEVRTSVFSFSVGGCTL